MAFAQLSLFFYPPRWQRYSVADARMKHYSGEPVRIVSAVRAEDSNERIVPLEDVCRWFEAKGFHVVTRSADYALFHSAAVESTFGPRAEIDVSASAQDGEVTSLHCRFQLNRETPFRLERWEAFIQELCAVFSLRISVSDTQSVGPDKFLTVVRQTDNWRYFRDQYGWSEPSE